jgi:hypothetical protein
MQCRKKSLTFALKTPKLTVCPAQFRTSVAKRLGSGLSCRASTPHLHTQHCLPYDGPSIDSNNEIKPRLQRHFLVRVPQDLEAIRSIDRGLLLLDRRSI